MFMEAIYLYVKFQQSGDLSLNVSEKKKMGISDIITIQVKLHICGYSITIHNSDKIQKRNRTFNYYLYLVVDYVMQLYGMQVLT